MGLVIESLCDGHCIMLKNIFEVYHPQFYVNKESYSINNFE